MAGLQNIAAAHGISLALQPRPQLPLLGTCVHRVPEVSNPLALNLPEEPAESQKVCDCYKLVFSTVHYSAME